MNVRWLLIVVFAFFMLVLGAAWVIAKRAHPVFLDEHGRPVTHQAHTHS